MLTSPIPMYYAKIIFPERMLYEFRITTLEELIFQIMSLDLFDDLKQSFKEFSKLDRAGTIYPTVIRVSRLDLLQLYQERPIVNPKLLWELFLNRYFYDMVNNETSKIMDYPMHHMFQFRHEDFLNNGVFFEDEVEMDNICRFKGICNKNNECYSCGFSYKLFREQ